MEIAESFSRQLAFDTSSLIDSKIIVKDLQKGKLFEQIPFNNRFGIFINQSILEVLFQYSLTFPQYQWIDLMDNICSQGLFEMMVYLLDQGYDVTWISPQAYYLAMINTHDLRFKEHFDQRIPYDINHKYGGETVLLIAIKNQNIMFIQELLQQSCELDLLQRFDEAQSSYVMYAAAYGTIEILQLLLTYCPSDLHYCDFDGNNALFFALERNKLTHISYLLDCGLNIHHKNKNGYTLLMLAQRMKHQELLDLLQPYL